MAIQTPKIHFFAELNKLKTNGMRKLIPFLALTLLATGACAQGVVTFANSVITPNTPYILDENGLMRLTGTQYAAQLYYGWRPASSLAAHNGCSQSLPCCWNPVWREPGPRQPVPNRTLTGGGVGVPVFLQVRVWNLDQFATYEAAVGRGGWFGTSAVFTYIQRLSSTAGDN
jgi:hypothetical protein